MTKDYLDRIEEFDEGKLPDIEINEEEINRVKKKVTSVIEALKNKNKTLDFNITLDEALKIKTDLGDNADKAIFGVESAGLMRGIVLKMVQEKEGLEKEDIVDELFREVHAPNWWRRAAICYKLFLTKEKIIIYSFDSQYKIFSHYKFNINEVKEAGEAGKAKCMIKEDEQIIVLPNATIVLYPNYGGKKSDLLRFMQSLKEAGVDDVNRSGFPWQCFMLKVVWVLVALAIVYLIMMCVNL